ncbi:hypothetical protein OsJ_10206 [Oryza sativa Japonica Group]|uniref:Ubiquitin-like domain-containing protein n=1 Tax=Oryza sativa subsp. japonica TaxID=39947 RepID=B9F749_ORYSJ|nr:hypothetical protein OsJ_10206 [Oryza sativa Japonica Group]
MRIYVKTLKGRIISLEVARSDTIASVKDKIYAERAVVAGSRGDRQLWMAGIHPRDQRFVFNARQLDDNQSLADCNITHNSTIHFVFGIPCFYATPAYEQFNRLPRSESSDSSSTSKGDRSDSSSTSKRDIAPANVKTVHCPDCQVQANVYYCNTKEDNEGCVFYRCPYFSIHTGWWLPVRPVRRHG